ncbi:MAG: insulinase family protein [Saprospiraceae bacterium]|nr:insulinase family protein [Saprospiraceae bacterium]
MCLRTWLARSDHKRRKLKTQSLIPDFERHVLDNGLTVLLQPDPSTALAAVCVLYKAGSRDERPGKTGIAHLFEHLMFSNCGPGVDFDALLQNAGGDCNAFTTTDTTQYYSIAPAGQLGLMLALEANRIGGYRVSKKDFITQRRVVLEEFSESHLNNPYGMFSHELMALAYETHPYRWPVIGEGTEVLEQLQPADAEDFYHRFYHPSNAILVITGHFDPASAMELVVQHFGHLKPGDPPARNYPVENKLTNVRSKTIWRDVPEEGFYYAFPCCSRTDPDFYALDFLTDSLSEGKSSLLYRILKKERMICSSVDCYLTSTRDPGLAIVEGKIAPGHSIESAQSVFWEILAGLKQELLDAHAMEKYRNKNESAYLFSQLGLMNQALNLSYAEWLGNPQLVYTEYENYARLTAEDIRNAAERYFPTDCYCSLYYRFPDPS